jgi:hypothetical protein
MDKTGQDIHDKQDESCHRVHRGHRVEVQQSTSAAVQQYNSKTVQQRSSSVVQTIALMLSFSALLIYCTRPLGP